MHHSAKIHERSRSTLDCFAIQFLLHFCIAGQALHFASVSPQTTFHLVLQLSSDAVQRQTLNTCEFILQEKKM